MDEFGRSLPKVLVHEGGWSNHPKDPGGATMKGVTQAVYDEWRVKHGKPKQSVRYIADDELQAIYRQNYWDKIRGDELPAGISYVVFDGAVNSGPSRSVKWLQKALGIFDDGVIGPGTLNAARIYKDKDKLVDLICDRRMKFLQGLPTWKTFGKGWKSRVDGVRKTGKEWA